MAANNISTLAYKRDRQLAKLEIAEAKRQGKVVATDGTISGTVDPTKSYYREKNVLDTTLLPTLYAENNNNTNNIVDNDNTGGLQTGRPWADTVVSYTVIPRQLTVDEGLGNGTVFDIYTTGVPDGNIYFTVTGTVSGADFTGGTLPSGSTFVTNGVSAVSFGLIEDNLTEGTENYALQLRTGSTSGPIVATSAFVTVNDTSTGSSPSSILTDNLVVHLDASNTNSYSGTGNIWTNLVDNTEYTIVNGSFDSANSGSILFNGSSTFVELGTILSNGTNLTKEAWVWDEGAGLSSRNVLSSASNVFFLSGSTLNAGIGNSFTLVSSSSFPTGVWRHVVQTFDDSTNTMRLYINGVEVDENTSVSESYVSEIERVGSHFVGSPNSFWNGKIAQIRVYSEALTEEQVTLNYNATKSSYEL